MYIICKIFDFSVLIKIKKYLQRLKNKFQRKIYNEKKCKELKCNIYIYIWD